MHYTNAIGYTELTKRFLSLNGCAGRYQQTQQSCRKHTPEFAVTKAHFLPCATQPLGSRCCFHTDGADERFPASVWGTCHESPLREPLFSPGGPGLDILAGRFQEESDTGVPVLYCPMEGKRVTEKPAARLLPPGGGQECLRDKSKDAGFTD